MNNKPIKYIVRKEDFQKAITDQSELRVIAVCDDGVTFFTTLSGYITKTSIGEGYDFRVSTSSMKNGHDVLVTVF